VLLTFSCNTVNNKSFSVDSSGIKNSSETLITADDSVKGLALLAKYDCATCHTTNKKIVGPAFQDVANKYAGNDTAINFLAQKIINGGGGVWDTIPMSQHINLSENDAEQIVKYIISLKTK
jgi:cytochrome c